MAAQQLVPASTRIRTSRTRNIETERLLARLEYLRDFITRSAEWAEQKSDFKGRVREILAIEIELDRREISYDRVTRRDW